MFLELNEMESMIKGNRDLKKVETLMGTTKEVVSSHMDAYDKLKDKILKLNDEADKAMSGLDFYDLDDEDEADSKPGKKKQSETLKEHLQIIAENIGPDSEDEMAVQMEAGAGSRYNKNSHQA